MEHLKAYTAELLDYTERVARTEIARWPDGDYQFTDYVDDDGMGSDPLPINVTLRVRGDSLTVDFTGTAPQAKSAINATRSWTKGCVYTAVRFAMNTDMPNNHGYFRPIEVITPKGSVVDLQFPAACTARHHVAVRTFDATMGALAKVLKDEVFAACDGQIGIMTLGGWGKDGRPFLHYEACCNAWGGRPTKDGVDGLGHPLGNIANISVERIEVEQPLRVEEYSLLPNTGGAGKYRGGLGIVRSWRFLEKEGVMQFESERRRFEPFGLHGGKKGTLSSLEMVHANGTVEPLPGKFVGTIRLGNLIRHWTPGAGGWGNPYERDVEAVLADVQEEKITVEHAWDEYGVAIEANTLRVDSARTEQKRHLMAENAKNSKGGNAAGA